MEPVKVRYINIGEGIPKICVPIVGTTREEILETAKNILRSSADLVEWRADWYEEVFEAEKVKTLAVELREILGNLPLLFTFRTKQEGGEKAITYARYAELLCQVADTGAVDLVDVEVYRDGEIATLISALKERKMVVLASNHDFAKTPSRREIVKRLCYMQDAGADISKIAVMPRSRKDVCTLMNATMEMSDKYAKGPIVTMSMSERGVATRLMGGITGSAITFGALGKVSAPGQIDVEELRKILEIVGKNSDS